MCFLSLRNNNELDKYTKWKHCTYSITSILQILSIKVLFNSNPSFLEDKTPVGDSRQHALFLAETSSESTQGFLGCQRKAKATQSTNSVEDLGDWGILTDSCQQQLPGLIWNGDLRKSTGNTVIHTWKNMAFKSSLIPSWSNIRLLNYYKLLGKIHLSFITF